MINLIDDVSVLTNIPSKLLEKIKKCEEYSIVENITELNSEKEKFIDLDLGIGTLSILVDDNVIKYKFIPSSSLDEEILSAIKYKKNILDLKLENSLQQKIEQTYRDLF